VKIESREGRKKLSIVPMGLNKEERILPSVKTPGYFQFEAENTRLASTLIPAKSRRFTPRFLLERGAAGSVLECFEMCGILLVIFLMIRFRRVEFHRR